MAAYDPDPKQKFTFGLWTVGNPGRDPFGLPTREMLSPVEIVNLIGETGAYGVNFHDNDLVPIDASTTQRDQIVKDFKKALKQNGLVVPMATTNLFSDPVFKDGAFTSNNARVRAYAIQKTMRAMDLGAECSAKIYVFWGGREGIESDATKDPIDAIKRFREAIDFLCDYSIEQNYGYKFAFEAKPNEPRGHMYFAVTGSYLALIPTLKHPQMCGVNPEVAHEHKPASTSSTRSPQPSNPRNSSTSISTTRNSAATTKTSVSAAPTPSTRFSSSNCSKTTNTPAPASSTPTPIGKATTKTSASSPRGACGRT